jgi:hypothetical protein
LLKVLADGIPEQFHGVFAGYPEDCASERHRKRTLTIMGAGFAERGVPCKWVSTDEISDTEWKGTVLCDDPRMRKRGVSFWWAGDGKLAMGGDSGRYERCPSDSLAALDLKGLDELSAALAGPDESQPVACGVKDGYGRLVSFGSKVELSRLPPSVEDPCDLARDMAGTAARHSQQRLDAYCGSYSGGCRSEDRDQLLRALSSRPEIYSVGTAQWGATSNCPAYLFVVDGEGLDDVQLRLMGECEGREAEIDGLVASKGGLYGDYVARDAGYTGATPSWITRQGKLIAFQSPGAPPELSPDDKLAHEYAKQLTANWSHMDHCFDLMQQLHRYTGTGEPAAAQMKRMDMIFDGAMRAGCIKQ